ncbi:MAG: ATP-binding protein, partial [Oceanisphaera sp.]|nr:ATP-binding protein [Oceanisphaera sp.]
IRTPLSNLMGHTEHTLRKPRSTEEYESLLASHQEEYERLARMVDSMLFLARAEQPKASINRQSLDLNELVDQLCEYFEGVAEDEDMLLLNQAEGIVWADPDLLRRALANLLANALRYGRTGGAVVISSVVEEGHCVVRVHNQGTPIGQEHLPRLFDRFYRCDASRTNSGNTGGLGLAIVRSIMQLHEGRVWVESDEGGTAFMLAFPERTPAAD